MAFLNLDTRRMTYNAADYNNLAKTISVLTNAADFGAPEIIEDARAGKLYCERVLRHIGEQRHPKKLKVARAG